MILNQSLKWNPQGNCKVSDQNPPERKKTLSEALIVAASKEKCKDLVRVPTVYWEINGNDNDLKGLVTQSLSHVLL